MEDKRFFEFMDATLCFYERYEVHRGTKVGGWPGWVQKPLTDPDGFVIQIASEGNSK